VAAWLANSLPLAINDIVKNHVPYTAVPQAAAPRRNRGNRQLQSLQRLLHLLWLMFSKALLSMAAASTVGVDDANSCDSIISSRTTGPSGEMSWRGCGTGWAKQDHQDLHRCLRGRPQSSPPPLLEILPISSRTRNKRHDTGLAPASTTAHQPPMGDDPPNSGEATKRQRSGRDRGSPVAVGVLVVHAENDETRQTLHHLGEPLKSSRWPIGTGSDVAHTSLLARRQPAERHFKEHEG